MKPTKNTRVTIRYDVTEFQTTTIEVPGDFASWETAAQQGYLDTKVSEFLSDQKGYQTVRHSISIQNAVLEGKTLFREFLIEPGVSAAGRSLLQAIYHARLGHPDQALKALKETCKSLQVPRDSLNILESVLREAAASESAPKDRRHKHTLDSTKTVLAELKKDIENTVSGMVAVRRAPYGLDVEIQPDKSCNDRAMVAVGGPDSQGGYRLIDSGVFQNAWFLEAERLSRGKNVGLGPDNDALHKSIQNALDDGTYYDEKIGKFVLGPIPQHDVATSCVRFADAMLRVKRAIRKIKVDQEACIKTTITDLQKDIEKALSGQVTVRRVPYGLAVGTLLEGPDDDRIGFYVAGPDALGDYCLTDNGQFLQIADLIEKEGGDPTDEVCRQTIQGILKDGGVLYDEKTGELVSAPIARSEVVEACRRFTDLLAHLRDIVQEEAARTQSPSGD